MARGQRSPHTGNPNWVKGVSGNPAGKAKMPKEILELQKLTVEEHVKVLTSQLRMTPAELGDVLLNPNSTMQELLIAKMLKTATAKGDAYTYEKLMDRVIGKVALPISGLGAQELSVEVGGAKAKLVSKLDSVAAAGAAPAGDSKPQ